MNFRQVHLDFHTSEKIPGIGSRFDKKQFQEALKAGHVNSITVFSKCHHGWAYHPSKANEIHPNLDYDLLGAQIEAAHEIGVKTPVYLSVGFDEKLAIHHPEWLLKDKNNETTRVKDFLTPGYHLFCLNTPYLDIVAEQIKEVCRNYDADGIFLDIVGVTPCYCANCIRTLRAEGKDPSDENAIMELAERTYANYAKVCREAIDSVKPGLPLFHNSGHIRQGRRDLAHMNSHLELESLPTGGWGYDHFPLSARYAQTLGMEYLGMTGKFHETWGEFGGFKHPNALRYEVALSVANGAKCSIGDQLHPTAEMDMATYRLIGEAYRELEEKEEWLDNVTPVADVALLSFEDYAVRTFGMGGLGNTTHTDAGAVRMLLEGKYLFNVIDSEADFDGYKVIILPDAERITVPMKEKLDAFLAKGGKLLASGKAGLYETKEAFAFDFGVDYVGESAYNPAYIRPMFEMEGLYDTSYIMYSKGEVTALSTGEMLAKQENPYFNRAAEHFCSHGHTPNSEAFAGPGMSMGKDGIYINWQIFTEYAQKGSLILKRIVQFALDKLLGEEITLKTNLGAQGVTTVMEQKDRNRYINHLLYASPVKRGADVEIIEDIVPVYGINVTLKLPKTIKKVYLAPQNTQIPFTCVDGKVAFTVDKIDCHQMVVLEY